MTIPFATTTLTVLRKVEQPDGYPDAEPVYAPIARRVRANLEIVPRRITGEVMDRSVAICRLTTDPCDLQALDYVRDEQTDRLWLVEWSEQRPGFPRLAHTAAQALDVVAEEAAAIPLVND